MAKWHKSKVEKRGSDYDFTCKWTPPDEEKPDRIITFGYVEDEHDNFGKFRSSCNREVKNMCDYWTAIEVLEPLDVSEDFEGE